MQQLIALISGLSTRERSNIAKTLTRFSNRGHHSTDFSKLFRLCVQYGEKNTTDAFYCKKIYGSVADKRFPTLKVRYKRKLISAITSETNILRNPRLELADKQLFIAQKNLHTALYIGKITGKTNEFLDLISETENIAKKFEYYRVLSECLAYKKFFRGYINGLKEFNSINKQIEFADFCSIALNKAADYYYKIILRSDFQAAYNKRGLYNKLRNIIYELGEDYRYTGSKTILYYQKYIEMEYFNIKEEFNTCEQTCKELLEIILNNRAVYRFSRLGSPYINLAYFQLKQGKYSLAAQNARQSLKYVKPFSNNYFAYSEYLFYSLFYDKRYIECRLEIERLLVSKDVSIGEFRKDKFKYMNICLLFMSGKYKEALSSLQQPSCLEDDKAGWGMGMRILRIQIAIAKNDPDMANSFYADLLRYYYRIRKIVQVSKRTKLIIEFLGRLHAVGFDFKQSDSTCRTLLIALSSSKKDLKWNPISPELIPVHDWYISHTTRNISHIRKEIQT